VGILKTRWQAEYRGHQLVVIRSELSKRLSLEWDGVEVAHDDTITGRGELHAVVEVDSSYRAGGNTVEIRAEITWGGSEELAHGKCRVTLNGDEVPVERVG
jgi:hypothetical protein